MQFHPIILLSGKSATGIVVPPEIVTGLGTSKRPKVRVTINGYTYRSSIASMGGKYMISVSEEVRKGAGVAAGDHVAVDVELDTEPRVVGIPPDLAARLESDADAKRFFDNLSYSNQQRLVLPIEQAKTAETRQRRVEKTVSELHKGNA